MPHPILLYDGVCGLCNRSVQFILRRDPQGIFRFAALQNKFSARILARHAANPNELDTVYLVVNHELPNEQLLARSDAVISVLKTLGGFWGFLAACASLVPHPLRDWGYHQIARRRYSLFGRYDACPLPTPQQRSRFLDL